MLSAYAAITAKIIYCQVMRYACDDNTKNPVIITCQFDEEKLAKNLNI